MTNQKVNESNLLEVLKKAELNPQTQPNTDQILLVFEHDEAEFPLFIRTLHEGELLQLMTFVPCNVNQDHATDLSRFMHMLFHQSRLW